MPIGEPSSTTLGTTSNFQLNRDTIIYHALLKVGGIEAGGVVSATQLSDCAVALNMIVRQEDVRDKNLWAISPVATYLPLAAGIQRYAVGSQNILELVTAVYQDAQNEDHPLKIITTEEYEALTDKLEPGDPKAVYLQNASDPEDKILLVHPVRTTVDTQSVVTGTDASAYRCIRSHTGSTATRPVTGSNYATFWELGGSGAVAWAADAEYSAGQQIRYTFKRPLRDFDLSTDQPDFPQAFARYLVYALAYDIADNYALSTEECRKLDAKRQQAYMVVFPGTQVPKSNNHYNKARDF